jgi:hypothetical protein
MTFRIHIPRVGGHLHPRISYDCRNAAPFVYSGASCLAGAFDSTGRAVIEIDSVGLGRDRNGILPPFADIAGQFVGVYPPLDPKDPNVAGIGDCPIGVQRGTNLDRSGPFTEEEPRLRCLAESQPWRSGAANDQRESPEHPGISGDKWIRYGCAEGARKT